MSLLDQLKTREDGARRVGDGIPSWRPVRDRDHPEGLEGAIVEVGEVPIREPREGGPTHDTVVVVQVGDDKWRVYGSVRDLRDGFDALKAQGLLEKGNTIAIRFLGQRKEASKDGKNTYQLHSYAMLAQPPSK